MLLAIDIILLSILCYSVGCIHTEIKYDEKEQHQKEGEANDR